MADEEDEGGGAESPKTVPYERFRETRAELRALKGQLESMKALESQVAELPTLKAELGRRDALLGLARAGILDDERKVERILYTDVGANSFPRDVDVQEVGERLVPDTQNDATGEFNDFVLDGRQVQLLQAG
jgi:hypothetical protein